MKNWQWGALCGLLVAVAAASYATGNMFALQLATRVVILALAAVGAQLIVGYGNLITLGHALFVGLGVYVVGACFYFSGSVPLLANGLVELVILLGLVVVVGYVTGTLSLKLRGIHFLMITLAFGQMFHLAAVSASIFGGDDGMPIRTRPQLPPLDLGSPYQRFALCALVLVASIYFVARIVASPFGLALRASASNDLRLASSGYDVLRVRIVAYIIAGTITSLAGYLLAIQSEFVSPAVMHWSRSGDLVIMVVIGGRLRVGGPLIGATVLVLIEEMASRYTESSSVVLGLLLVGIAFARSVNLAWFRHPRLIGARTDA